MCYKGIDHGLGTTNIDKESGIRYGVIPAADLGESWYESADSDYGKPHCPKCGNELEPSQFVRHCTSDFYCPDCEEYFDPSETYGDTPLGHFLDDGEYKAEQGGEDCDVFITKSPYYTRAQFCSPCAPGACYLRNPIVNGEKAYCFSHDWFPEGKAPYPVFRVDDDSEVEPE